VRISIRADKIDTFNAGVHHMRDGIAATASDADHFDDRALTMCIH
jgi:hypothetical protein